MEYIPAKNIVTKSKTTYWFGTDYNMNIYRGCSHGCIYCDSRSDCYRVTDFDTVKAKKDALQIIRDELEVRRTKGVIATGSMSDPYNPYEAELKLTHNALELIHAYRFGVAIATKSPLVTRDIPVLKDIASYSPVIVKMTITTADDAICKMIEPHVAPTSERFKAIRTLAENNLYAGILLMPLLPFINDTEENIEAIITLAKQNGARFIYFSPGVTLRANQRDYFYDKLDQLFPGIKQKYIKCYGERYSCGSPNAKKLYQYFTTRCNELGLLYDMKDIIRSYKTGYGNMQLSLF